MQEKLPNVYEITLSSKFTGMSQTKVFLIPGKKGERSLMIDAGFRNADSRIILDNALKTVGIHCSNLDIFISHKHSDHCGQAKYFADKGANVFMSPHEETHVYNCMCCNVHGQAVDELEQVLNYMGITINKQPELWNLYHDFNNKASEEKNWLLMTDDFPYYKTYEGQLFSYGDYVLKVISLKGHTMGQIGLFDSEHGILFCADQMMKGMAPFIGTSYPNEHLLSSYLDSLEWIRMHSGSCLIIPSHGREIADVAWMVDWIRRSYMEKIQRIIEILENAKGKMTVKDITYQFSGMNQVPKNDREFIRLRTAMAVVFSCLEYLNDQGRVLRLDENKILYWTKI